VFTSGGAVVTNQYGLLIDSLTTATNNYAISTSRGLVQLGDATTITSPTAATIPLTLKGEASQSAVLLSITDSTNAVMQSVSAAGKTTFNSTITAGGTTGDQTINKPSGTVNIAAAGTTVTVTNSLVTTSSIVVAVIRTNDTTAYIKNVVPASGSFVINLGAAATAEISVGFIVYN
jgi:hypothetical protein